MFSTSHRRLLTRRFHFSPPLLHWTPRSESKLAQPELLTRITRLLTLHRFDALSRLPFTFSDDLLDSVLAQLRLNPSACLGFFQLARKQQYFRPNIKSYCKLIHILARARMYDETRCYLNDLVCLCRNSHSLIIVWGEIVKVYREFGFSPTVFEMMLRVYVERGMVRNALHVFDNMGKCGRTPTLKSCNSLLSCLVKSRENHTAVLVYEQMVRIGVVPDVFTRAIIVKAYCNDGKVKEAMDFVEGMESKGFEVNVVGYNSLIDGYVGLGDMEGMAKVIRMMRKSGVEANVVTYTLFVKGYVKCGKIEDAENFVEEMEKDVNAHVDEHIYGVLIDGYCRIGKMEDALRIKDRMLKAGLRVNLFICNSIINGYCKFGQVNEAERMMVQTREWHLKPDTYSYNTLVDGYCREGLLDKAFELCDVMVRKGIEPSVVTYNALLKGLCRLGFSDDILRLWNTMLDRGVTPNAVSCCTLLDLFVKLEDVERAFVLWKEILARGLAKNSIVFNTMINGLCKMNRLAEAEEVFQKMKDSGCLPDRITYRILSDAYRKVGDHEKASLFSVKCMSSSSTTKEKNMQKEIFDHSFY